MFTRYHTARMVMRITLYIQFSAWILLALAGCGGDNIPVASVLSSGRVTLSWDEVPGAASYELYISTSPGVTILNSYKIDDVTPPFTITDLEPGTTYYFMVAVFSDSGESRTSEEVDYTVTGTDGEVDFGNILAGSESVEQPQSQTQPTAKTSAAATAAAAAAGQKPGSQPAAAPAVKSSSDTIICFGDSLTAGTGASAGMDYPSQLARMIGKPVINKGIPGDTTTSARRRLNRDVLSANPDIVLITLGGNDLKNGVAPKVAFGNLKYIVETLQSRGARVIIGGLKFSGNDRGFGKGYEDLATQTGATLIPNIFDGIFDNLDLMSDAIHPNDAGYRIIARRFQRALAARPKAGQTGNRTSQTTSKAAIAPAAVKAASSPPATPGTAPKLQDVTLAWDDDSDVDHYNVYWSKDPDFPKDNRGKERSTGKSYTIKGLEKDEVYYFKVTGENKSGEGPPSDILKHKVGE